MPIRSIRVVALEEAIRHVAERMPTRKFVWRDKKKKTRGPYKYIPFAGPFEGLPDVR